MIQVVSATVVLCPKGLFMSFCLCALLFLPVQGIASTTSSSSQSTADLQSRLEAALEEHHVAGASVAIWREGKLETAAAGVTNITTGVPITTDTIMHIGSITKVFTATLIMQLVDQGLVELDKPLKTYLPDFTLADKDAEEKITVKMLLNHTSGIDDGGILGDTSVSPDAQRIVDGVIKTGTMTQIHPPGEELSYCNIGFVLLGYLAEQITGKSWYQLVEENIYRPLEMDHSIARAEDALLYSASVGHYLNPETNKLERTDKPFLGPYYFAPAGSTLMMTASDLVTFARAHINEGLALNGSQILSAKGVGRMNELTVHSKDVSRPGFGLGWMVYENSSLTHSGGNRGTVSWLYAYPKKDMVIAIFTNSSNGMNVIKDIRKPVLNEVGLPSIDAQEKSIVVRAKDEPIKNAAAFVGTYSAMGMSYVVKKNQGKLTLSHIHNHSDTKNISESKLWPAGNGYFVGQEKDSSSAQIYRFINPNEQGVMELITSKRGVYKRKNVGVKK